MVRGLMSLAGGCAGCLFCCGSVADNRHAEMSIANANFIEFSLLSCRLPPACAAEGRRDRNLFPALNYGPRGVTIVGIAGLVAEGIDIADRPQLRFDLRR